MYRVGEGRLRNGTIGFVLRMSPECKEHLVGGWGDVGGGGR